MWRSNRYLLSCLLLGALFLLTGCVTSLARKVRVDEVVEVRYHGTVGATVELIVTNDSRREITIDEIELQGFHGDTYLGKTTLHSPIPIELAPRSTTQVATRWKFHFDHFAIPREELFAEIIAAVHVSGKRYVIRLEKMPVWEFLHNFAP